jgi:rRNA maturation RNase YbeY
MQINYFTEELDYRLRGKNKLREWISAAIDKEGLETGVINYIFCSDKYLLKINEDYLQHFDFTDVITFDYSAEDIISGDIFISIDRIKENAQQFKQKFTDELHRVMIHGVLHLMSYKDKSPSDKSEMTAKEDYYLSLRPEIK